MRWLKRVLLTMSPAFLSAIALSTFLKTPAAVAQDAVVDLRKYQHYDGTIRPATTFIPGYSKPQTTLGKSSPSSDAGFPPAPAVSTASDIITIQPKLNIRNVGNLREKMTVVRGQDLMGRAEFDVSCSVGAAYAHIPGEETGYRFTRQSDCKAILQSESVTSPCRSRLAVNRQTKTVSLIGQACGAGPFPVAKDARDGGGDGLSSNDSADALEADSLSERARAARLRARSRTAR